MKLFMQKKSIVVLALLKFLGIFLLLPTLPAFAQSAPIWTGSITCQLDDEEQGVYQRQEIQTWTLTGAPPTNPDSIPIYQATWQAQAQGQLLRTQQATQTTTSIQWVANVPAPGGQAPLVPIVIRFRTSDEKMIISQWRAPMGVPNALNGQRQIFVNGVSQGQPAPFSRSLQEWKFPLIEAPNDSTISGTMQAPVDPGTAELVHRYGGVMPIGTCQWKLTKAGGAAQSNVRDTMGNRVPTQPQLTPFGNSGPQNNSPTGMAGGTQNSNPQGTQSGTPTTPAKNPNCDSPAAVQQSFEAMKADIKSSYDALIQGTTDQAQIAAFTQQEQKTLENLTTQEQRAVQQATADGCTGAGQARNGQGSTNPPIDSNSAGGGQTSTTSSGSPIPVVTPSPINVTATAGDGSATISWSAPTLPAGVSITTYRVTSVSGGGGKTSQSSPVTISGLTNGTSYTFQVVAISGNGNSQPTLSNSVTPLANGGVPSITSIYPTQEVCNQYRSFQLTGQNTHFAHGTTSVDFGPGMQQRALGFSGQTIDAHMFILSTATPGPHTVTVTTGSEVVTTTFTVNSPCNPDPPTNVVATAGNASAVVTWTAPAGIVTSYTVQPLAAGALSAGPGITTTTNQATVPGLSNGTAYTIQVTASAGSLSSTPASSNQVTPTSASSSSGSGSSGLPMATQTPNHVASMGLLTGVSPATNSGQQNVTVTLTGQLTNFVDGKTTVSFARTSQPGPSVNVNAAVLKNLSSSGPPPVQVGTVKVNSKTSATVTLSMNPSTAAGTYSITATTPTSSGTPEVVTLNNGFSVTTTPTLNITPGTIGTTGITKNTGSNQTPAAPASAKYRVIITGLMCMKHISSDDAIYAAAVVRQYDRRNNQNTMFTNLNTWVYGDINGMISQRKQAGTRGPGGGIGDGDLVPMGFMPGTRDTMPTPQVNNLLPLTLWEGTLTDGVDALVISPSLWINYGDNPLFSTWNQNQDSFTNSILMDPRVQNQINNQTLGTLVLGPGANVSGSVAQATVHDAATMIVDTILVIPFVELQGGPSHDRPVGLADANPSDPTSSTILPNTTLVLTREMIEKRLGSGSWMMMPLDLNDTAHSFTGLIGADRPGEYQMFLQIERQ